MATEIAIFQLKTANHPRLPTALLARCSKTPSTPSPSKNVSKEHPGTPSPRTQAHFDCSLTRILLTPILPSPSHCMCFRFLADSDRRYSSHCKPFLKRFGRRFGQMADLNSAQLFHSHFTPHLPSKGRSDHVSPTTAIEVVYFPSDFKDDDGFLET